MSERRSTPHPWDAWALPRSHAIAGAMCAALIVSQRWVAGSRQHLADLVREAATLYLVFAILER